MSTLGPVFPDKHDPIPDKPNPNKCPVCGHTLNKKGFCRICHYQQEK